MNDLSPRSESLRPRPNCRRTEASKPGFDAPALPVPSSPSSPPAADGGWAAAGDRRPAGRGCIVCAIDGTAHGSHVARLAGRLSGALGLRAVLVHVAPTRVAQLMPPAAPLPSTFASDPLPPADLARRSELEAESADAVLERTAEAELRDAELRPELGDPASRILAVADEVGADLIVLGSRRLGALATFFLGSVSRQVVRDARCPVVIVPDGAELPALSLLAAA